MPLTAADILDALTVPKQCTAKGCQRTLEAHGYCVKHYERVRRTGTAADPGPAKSRRERKRCTVPNCTTHVKARGLCEMHYARWRNGGTPLNAPRKNWFRKPCQVPGCDRPHKQHGFCSLHWDRLKRWIAQQCD